MRFSRRAVGPLARGALLLAAILPAAVVTVDPSPPERLRPEDDLGWAARILEAEAEEEEELLMMTWRRPATSSPRQ